jgi:hypothetical protein
MKKIITLSSICLCMSVLTYGQKTDAKKAVLTKKESRQILEKAWNYVKTNDTTDLIKMWVMDATQWPYHTTPFTANEIKNNYYDFKSYFDTAISKNLKFDEVDCDTVEHIDPHYDFSKYYIKAWFKYTNTRRGFGFYMDYVNDKWLIRFSPDYSEEHITKK